MGDRVNVGIRGTDGNTIFLYLHWGGEDANEIVARAIAHSMSRGDDEAYLTRIFVSRVIDRDWDKETGVGMSINKLSAMGDGYPVPVYDYANKTISLHEEKWDSAGGYIDLEPQTVYNVDEYLAKFAIRGVGAYA